MQCGCVFRAFLCCTLAGNATQRLVLRVTALVKLLTTAVMVDNPAEKVDECPLKKAKSGSLSIVCIQLGPRKPSVIRSSGVSTIEGLLKY